MGTPVTRLVFFIVSGCILSLQGGQIGWLVSNQDGDSVILGTDRPLLGESSPVRARLYELDGVTVRLIAKDEERFGCQEPFAYPALVRASSGITFTRGTECARPFAGSPYAVSIQNNPWIPNNTPATALHWSGSGNFAFLDGPQRRLVRMSDGQTTDLSSTYPANLTRPSNLGQFVAMNTKIPGLDSVARPHLWQNGQLTDLGIPDSIRCALDPQGRYVACATAEGSLLVASLLSQETRVLIRDLKVPRLTLSADGDRLLLWDYYDNSPIVFSMPDGNGIYRAELPPLAGGFPTLSGNGRYLFYQRTDHSVHRLDLETSLTEEWLPPVPTP